MKVSKAAARFKLSPRETQIVVLLAAGEPQKSIASTVGSAVRTVQEHITRIGHKCGVRSSIGIVGKILS